MSKELKETLAEIKVLDGDLKGCVRTLQSAKLLLASSLPEVANAWRTKIKVEGRRPARPWQEAARALGFDPNDPRFTFKLDKSHVMGPEGPIEVGTQEFYGSSAEAQCRWGWRCRY